MGHTHWFEKRLIYIFEDGDRGIHGKFGLNIN